MVVSTHAKKHKLKTSTSPPCVIFCEELFLPSKKKKCYSAVNNDVDRDPLVAAHVAAQSHFSLRPNIYLWEIEVSFLVNMNDAAVLTLVFPTI